MKATMRHGTGIHYYLNWDFYDGEWQQDKRVGRGRIFHKDGSKLIGGFTDDRLEGSVEFEDAWGNFIQTDDEVVQPKKQPKKAQSRIDVV